ncbi:FKBP-type peptidyl-prolyl cis-trans isomerase [Chitinophaga japonensis]|uniref:Peptidyl-prolyl cis-trans isomerase n=1 Tax=Chitinophaga japonensis TaxID=104662 RepID=A0A562SUK4_CHIJA|nr:FKBP-type peptidyl-prolyl cis-trans isomerase [Chitinophaga japonensis]TWI84340.1 FKBP-type peptidyl-prolyl isomerase-like protein [Chitinophaga japonensis]
MKLILQTSLYCITCILLSGCAKKESSALLENMDDAGTGAEQARILQYIHSHNLQLTKDPTGLYYAVIDKGDSTSFMTLENVPYITYTRRFLDDKLIDVALGPTDFDGRPLKDHIAGWQIGLQKVAKGGRIFMIIPSALGFGNISVEDIPANSVLVCEVGLVDFK